MHAAGCCLEDTDSYPHSTHVSLRQVKEKYASLICFIKMTELCQLKSVLLYLFFIIICVRCDEELWKKDMTDEIYIATSHEGFEYVNLTCTNEEVN